MPLLYHAGALGDFLLAFPVLRAAARAWAGPWTLAVPEAHAELVARLFPGARRRSPADFEFSPLAARLRKARELRQVASRYGGLLAFVSQAEELEALSAGMRSQGTAPAVFVESPATALKRGERLEARLAAAVARLRPELARAGGIAKGAEKPAPAALDAFSFALHEEDLPAGAAPPDPQPPQKPFAAIHLGAGDPRKEPPESLLRAIAGALRRRGIPAVWILGPCELERGSKAPPGTVWSAPSLPRLAAGFLRAALYCGGDTGPTHLAAQLGIPVLLLARDDPGPWRPRHRNPRRLKIAAGRGAFPGPGAVARALDDLLGAHGARTPP